MNVRRARWALPLAAALLGVAAFAAFASDTFTDVPSGAYYHDEVNALLNAGITAGCGGLHYCPNRAVTRGEMALFLNRLGALGDGTSPVVDARSINGHASVSSIALFFLPGSAPVECAVVAADAPFGTYSIHYTLFDTPAGIAPAQVNVQLVDDDDQNNQYQVCFASLAGTNLPGGQYGAYFSAVKTVGQGVFG